MSAEIINDAQPARHQAILDVVNQLIGKRDYAHNGVKITYTCLNRHTSDCGCQWSEVEDTVLFVINVEKCDLGEKIQLFGCRPMVQIDGETVQIPNKITMLNRKLHAFGDEPSVVSHNGLEELWHKDGVLVRKSKTTGTRYVDWELRSK